VRLLSFSYKVKDELCNIKVKNNCCKRAEIAAFLQTVGTVLLKGKGNMNIKFYTENAAVARRIYSLVKNNYEVTPKLMVSNNERFQKPRGYTLFIEDSDNAKCIIKDAGILYCDAESDNILKHEIDSNVIKKRCCKRSYMRAAFLGIGSITDPEKDYHLELVTDREVYAQSLIDLMRYFDINAKYIERKNNYVVYLKGSEEIIRYLNVLRANNSLLEIESVKVFKDVRNNINRLVNCETANLTKTVNAALEQIADICYIRDTIGLENLPPQLKQLAKLRLDYKDASLRELGEMLDPPLSKSGVNHRLKKISRLAEYLKEKRGAAEK